MRKLLIIFTICALAFSKSLLEEHIYGGVEPLTRDNAFKVYKSYVAKGKDDASFETFYKNFQTIQNHNMKTDRSFDMAINRFSFMTFDEVKQRYMGAQNCSATNNYRKNPAAAFKGLKVPVAVDWRDNGVITPVKDQRNCGSCWAFSTTGALEAHWAIKTGVSPNSLSEQHLIECSQAFSNYGCNGGLPSQAFEFIQYNGGIASEDTYYYIAKNGTNCTFDPTTVTALAPGGSVNITFQDEDELLQTVANIGPVSIAFSVQDDFMQYSGGIYDNENCPTDPQSVNHAVLVVGYGSEAGVNYWIMKNSWNEHWGENGYFRIKRGVNMCGLADCAAYPDVNGTSADSFIEMKKEIKNISID